jgi:hypothetical protein
MIDRLRLALDWIVNGSRARWLIASFGLCTILPWFFSCPALRPNPAGRETVARYWQGIVQRKIDHPLYDYTREFPPESNEAKRNFRMLVPLLARASGLGFTGVHLVRFGLQAVLLVGLLLAAERACADRLTALGAALTITGTQVGTAVWRDAFGWFDNCAHAFVVLAILARNPWLAGTAAVAGLFVDERVLCALPLVALFHAVTGGRRSTLLGLGGAVPVYLATRAALSWQFGLHNPLAWIGVAPVLIPNLANAPAAFWFGLEGGWLFMAAATRGSASRQREIAGLFVWTLLVLMASGLVGDFTRSTSYAFPAPLVALAILARSEWAAGNLAGLRRLAGLAAAVSLFVPNGFVIWENVVFESSLPVRIVQAWLRSL